MPYKYKKDLKARNERYRKSKRGHALILKAIYKYYKSEKGKACTKRYQQSEKYKRWRRKYRQRPYVREKRRLEAKRYRERRKRERTRNVSK